MFNKWHPSVTPMRVVDAARRQHDDARQSWLLLGVRATSTEGCEPDARGYDCEACGEPQVFGADELMLHINEVNRFKIPAIFPER